MWWLMAVLSFLYIAKVNGWKTAIYCAAGILTSLLMMGALSAQEVDEATKAWALRRAYQLNGDSMVGCHQRSNGEWSCNSIDLSGEIRNAQSGPRPDPVAPVVEQMPAPPVKKKK